MAPVFIKRYGQIKGSTSLLGFRIDQREESVPIIYLEDNKNYTPVSYLIDDDYLGYAAFNYGSWQKEFFMNIKPCVLGFDGNVVFYLKKDDYTKREDTGETVDISNSSLEGNVMVEFPKSYYKIVNNEDSTIDVYLSNNAIDEDFVCWAFLDENENEIPYCYMSAYNCKQYLTNIGGNSVYTLRSLSNDGKKSLSKNLDSCISLASANGSVGNEKIWNVERYCDRTLMQIYAMLIGKSVSTQEVFGHGKTDWVSGTTNISTNYSQGLYYNNMGMFAAAKTNLLESNDYRYRSYGIKFFGMEDYWGMLRRHVIGISKLGHPDGGYAFYTKMNVGNGTEGGIYTPSSLLTYSASSFLPTKMKAGNDIGFLPIEKREGISNWFSEETVNIVKSKGYRDVGYSPAGYCNFVYGGCSGYNSGKPPLYRECQGIFTIDGLGLSSSNFGSGEENRLACSISCKPKAS